MVVYLRYNGRHFNRKLVEFATSKMTTRDSNGTEITVYEIIIENEKYFTYVSSVKDSRFLYLRSLEGDDASFFYEKRG